MVREWVAVDARRLLLAVMVSIAGLIFVGSFQYNWNARLFPQVTSTVVIAGGSGLLLRDLIQGFPGSSVRTRQEAASGDDPDWLDIEQTATTNEPTNDGDEVGFIIWLTGFITTGLLVGFLYATPVFVLAYGRWKALSSAVTIGLTLLTTLITCLFMFTLNLQLAEGYLLG